MTPNQRERLERLRRLSRLLDDSIPVPGTDQKVGLEALIGLVPGVGDLLGVALASYIVVQAHALGVPRVTVLRMLFNLGIDALVGSVPILGDLFDFVWKANVRNVALVEARIGDGSPPRGGKDVVFLVLIVSVCLLVTIGVFALSVLLVGGLIDLIRG